MPEPARVFPDIFEASGAKTGRSSPVLSGMRTICACRCPAAGGIEDASTSATGPGTPMDRFDALLLEAIQRDNRATAGALSRAVGLSPDACRKRLGRLRRQGYVEADIAVLSPERAGRGLILLVEVTLEKERRADLEGFKRRMLDAPEVMQCYYVTGAADFFLVMSACSMGEYTAFTRRHFFDQANVVRFTTSVVMDRVKTGFYLPVGIAAPEADGA